MKNKVLVRLGPMLGGYQQTLGVTTDAESAVETVGDALIPIVEKLNKAALGDYRKDFAALTYYLVEEFGIKNVSFETSIHGEFNHRVLFTLGHGSQGWGISQVAVLPSPEAYFRKSKRREQEVYVTEADKGWVRAHGFDQLSFGERSGGKRAIV